MSDVPAEQPASPAKYVPTKNWGDDEDDEFESATKLSEEERKALLEKAEASKEEGTLDPGTLNEQEEGGDDEAPSSSSSSSSSSAEPAAAAPGAAAQTNFLKQKGSAPIDTRVTFEQLLGNRQDLLSVLGELKFTNPSKIQAATISRIVNGESFKAESPSGTGKTAAFGLGAILSVDVTLKTPQVIIVSPARELAIQTHINVAALGKNVEGLEIKLCIATDRDGAKGSKPKAPRPIEKALTAQIVIGTPGTLKNKKWDPKYAKVLVLDEADFLLEDQYNIKDIILIKKKMKKDAQVLGYSATFTDAIKEAFKEVCPVKHKYIFWKRDPSDLTLIKQYKVLVNDENIKVEILKDILTASSAAGQNIIFCQTKSTCHTVIQKLKSERYDADELTSDSTFEERDRTITHFIKGELNSLVSTNVLARGIDIQNVNLVINFDVPVTFNTKRTPVGDKTTYIHRIGRTGRWDRTGIAINIVSKADAVLLSQIERALNTEIEEIPFSNLLDTLDAIFVAADC